MEKQIEQKVKPEEQKRHLIKAYLDDDEFEKFQKFAKACKCTTVILFVGFWQARILSRSRRKIICD